MIVRAFARVSSFWLLLQKLQQRLAKGLQTLVNFALPAENLQKLQQGRMSDN